MSKPPSDVVSNLPKTAELIDPCSDAIRSAFLSLPRRGSLHILCGWTQRTEALIVLADCGAFAVRADPTSDFDRVRITVLKGKTGACYETGRFAAYLGAAAAAMDDDRHLIAGALRVCEKTGGLYQLPPYSGLLRVTAADADLLLRLDTEPVPFDCNTFEADAARIAASLAPVGAAATPDAAVYYPGPFSLLVLTDGSIVRRGRPVRVAEARVPALRERDGLLLLPAHRSDEARPAVDYRDGYAAAGAGCLIEELQSAPAAGPAAGAVPIPDAAWEALMRSPAPLRERIRRLVADREPYFILTGSDPRDAGGCCPSTDVGAANRLVEAGMLASHRIPAPADACTTTVYAFAGEIDTIGIPPRFAILDDFRRRAAAALPEGTIS